METMAAVSQPVPRRRTGLAPASLAAVPDRPASPPFATAPSTPSRDFRLVHNWRVGSVLVPALGIVAATAGHHARLVLLIGYVAAFALDRAQFVREHALISVWVTVLITAVFLWVTFISAIRISPWNLLLAHNMTQVLFLTGLWGALQFPWIWRESPTIARLMERLLIGILPLPASVLYVWALCEVMGSRMAAFLSSPILTVIFALVSIPLPRSESANFSSTFLVLGWIERSAHVLMLCLLPAVVLLSSSNSQLGSTLVASSAGFLVCFPLLLIHALPLESWRAAMGIPSVITSLGAFAGFVCGSIAGFHPQWTGWGIPLSGWSFSMVLAALVASGPLADRCGLSFSGLVTSFVLFLALLPPYHSRLVGIPCAAIALAYFVVSGRRRYQEMSTWRQLSSSLKRTSSESPAASPSAAGRVNHWWQSPAASDATAKLELSSSASVSETLLYWGFILALLVTIWDGVGTWELMGLVMAIGLTNAIVGALLDVPSRTSSPAVQTGIAMVELLGGMCLVLLEARLASRTTMRTTTQEGDSPLFVPRRIWRWWYVSTSVVMLFLALLLSLDWTQRQLIKLEMDLSKQVHRTAPGSTIKGKPPTPIRKQSSKPSMSPPPPFLLHPAFVLRSYVSLLLRVVFNQQQPRSESKDENEQVPTSSSSSSGAAAMKLSVWGDISRAWWQKDNLARLFLLVGGARLCSIVLGDDHLLLTLALLVAAMIPMPLFNSERTKLLCRLATQVAMVVDWSGMIDFEGRRSSSSSASSLVLTQRISLKVPIQLILAVCVTLAFESKRATTVLVKQGRQSLNLSLAFFSMAVILAEIAVGKDNDDATATMRDQQRWFWGFALGAIGSTLSLLDIGENRVFLYLAMGTWLPIIVAHSVRPSVSLLLAMNVTAAMLNCWPSLASKAWSSVAFAIVPLMFSLFLAYQLYLPRFPMNREERQVSVVMVLTMNGWMYTNVGRAIRFDAMGLDPELVHANVLGASIVAVSTVLYIFPLLSATGIYFALRPFAAIMFIPLIGMRRSALVGLIGSIVSSLDVIVETVRDRPLESTIAAAQIGLSLWWIMLAAAGDVRRSVALVMPAWFATAMFGDEGSGTLVALVALVAIIVAIWMEEKFQAWTRLESRLWTMIPSHLSSSSPDVRGSREPYLLRFLKTTTTMTHTKNNNNSSGHPNPAISKVKVNL